MDQYRLLQLCIQPAEKSEIDRAWNELVKNTTSLNGMRSYLMMESSRWQRCNRRLQVLHTESLALITQACETYLVMSNHPEVISAELKTMLSEPAQTPAEIHQQMKNCVSLLLPATVRRSRTPSAVGLGQRLAIYYCRKGSRPTAASIRSKRIFWRVMRRLSPFLPKAIMR